MIVLMLIKVVKQISIHQAPAELQKCCKSNHAEGRSIRCRHSSVGTLQNPNRDRSIVDVRPRGNKAEASWVLDSRVDLQTDCIKSRTHGL